MSLHTVVMDVVRCTVVLLALAVWVGGSTFAMIAADDASRKESSDAE